MNTRLSQRVYSESALEFWLQRLDGDWEKQFDAEELAQGRRLYRQGAVRQLELGGTDAIVHMRLEGAEEAYVVLDWEAEKLAIRASVQDAGLRRLLAVVGLYEVEELVGDEASALPPELRARPAGSAQADGTAAASDAAQTGGTAQTGDAAAGKATQRSDAAVGDAQASANAGGAQKSAGASDAPQSTHTATDAQGTNRGAGSGVGVTAGGGQTGVSPSTGAAGNSVAQTAESVAGAGSGSHGAGDGLDATAGQGIAATAEPERRLELHFNLRQGLLAFRAGWRQRGRKRLLPALGKTAPDAESMTVQERETLIRLASLARRSGFRYEKDQGGYCLDTPERMVQFVAKELGGWSEFFDVTQEADVTLLGRGVQEVSLRARIGEAADGDSLSLHWMAGFEQDLPGREQLPAFTTAERRRLLRSGATPLLLPGRGLVRLSERQAKASERLLDAVNLFPGGTAPRYLLFSLVGLSDLPVEVSASLQRWRQSVLGGNLDPKGQKQKITKTAAGRKAQTTLKGKNDAAGKKAAAGDSAAVGGSAMAGDPAAVGKEAASGDPAAANPAADSPPADEAPLPGFLRPYQRVGVGWMRHLFKRGCHGLLADEMGLGKTVQVLSLIATTPRGDKPSLVVCPASVVPVWQAQAAQFFPELKLRVLGADSTFVGESTEPTDLWLASYTQLRRHKGQLEQVRFDCAVLDEAQFIKNPEAKVTQACLSIKAEHRLALTGTPLENRYLDVWTLFRFLMPGLLGTRRRFEEALAGDEARHLTTLRKQLAPFILRRIKSEVAGELPEKVELDLYCPLSEIQRAEYTRLLAEGVARYSTADATGATQQGAGGNESAGSNEGGRLGAAAAGTRSVAAEQGEAEQDYKGGTLTAQLEAEQTTAAEFGEALPTEQAEGQSAARLDARTANNERQSEFYGNGQASPSGQSASNGQAASSGNGKPVASDKSASGNGGQPGVMSVLTLLTRLRQVACDPALLPWMQDASLHHSGKLNLLRDRLGEVFANGKKAVVFSQFVKFLDRAKQAISADYPDVPIYQLIGTTRDRTRPVERFQSQEGAGVMLVSLKAGGTGITLNAADYVFLLDPWWNPAVEAQAIDRVHRIGQVNRVFVYRMVTAETVEARIAALKQTKRERFEQIVSGASGSDDFREAFRSLESLLGLLQPATS